MANKNETIANLKDNHRWGTWFPKGTGSQTNVTSLFNQYGKVIYPKNMTRSIPNRKRHRKNKEQAEQSKDISLRAWESEAWVEKAELNSSYGSFNFTWWIKHSKFTCKYVIMNIFSCIWNDYTYPNALYNIYIIPHSQSILFGRCTSSLTLLRSGIGKIGRPWVFPIVSVSVSCSTNQKHGVTMCVGVSKA